MLGLRLLNSKCYSVAVPLIWAGNILKYWVVCCADICWAAKYQWLCFSGYWAVTHYCPVDKIVSPYGHARWKLHEANFLGPGFGLRMFALFVWELEVLFWSGLGFFYSGLF